MATNPDRIYWDSNVYLDFLKKRHPLHMWMQYIMDDWRNGGVEIVTSALTIAEVLWWRTDNNPERELISRVREEEIRALFNPPQKQRFRLVEVSRVTAEQARELVWTYGIKPKDAIHVASALAAKVPVMHTSDKELVAKSRWVGGNPVLEITYPKWIHQSSMSEFLRAVDLQNAPRH